MNDREMIRKIAIKDQWKLLKPSWLNSLEFPRSSSHNFNSQNSGPNDLLHPKRTKLHPQLIIYPVLRIRWPFSEYCHLKIACLRNTSERRSCVAFATKPKQTHILLQIPLRSLQQAAAAPMKYLRHHAHTIM